MLLKASVLLYILRISMSDSTMLLYYMLQAARYVIKEKIRRTQQKFLIKKLVSQTKMLHKSTEYVL